MVLKLNIFKRIDNLTTYQFDKTNRFIVKMEGIRESTDPKVQLQRYTLKELEIYFNNSNTGDNKLVIFKEGNSYRHFIVNEVENLVFIPLCNNKKIITHYCITLYQDFEKIKNHKLISTIVNKKVYCRSSTTGQYLQEIIFGRKARKGYKLDHNNSDGLDNRSFMIREISNVENAGNRKIDDGSKGKFQGVTWRKEKNKWRARIIFNKKEIHLGHFDDQMEAVKVHDMYSVHFYQGIKALNQINGVNVLSDEEIQNVLKNGIPEKYIIKSKERDLPPNISKSENKYTYTTTYTKYFRTKWIGQMYLKNLKDNFLQISSLQKAEIREKDEEPYFKICFSEKCDTLEIAIEKLEKLKFFIKELDELEKRRLENEIDQNRNKVGCAVLKVYNGYKKKYVYVEIDDDDWKEYIHFSWHIDGRGYPRNTRIGDLHLLVFIKNFKEIYENRRSNETVDHKDRRKKNVRRENLRLATYSEQNQNKEYERKNLLLKNYTGVNFVNGKFYAIFRFENVDQKSEYFEYLEDAAAKYNEFVLSKLPNGKINIIPETKTNISMLFGKDNITLEYINSINTVCEIKEIFRNNKDWKEEVEVSVRNLKNEDIEYYKKVIKNLWIKENSD